MKFDIHQQIFGEGGEFNEEESIAYLDQLIELFLASPEAQKLVEKNINPGGANHIIDYGMQYLGITPPQFSAQDMEEILFDLIPQKLSTPAEQAPYIIEQARAIWTFLQREFSLSNAAECLQVLNKQGVESRLQEALSNPANFGMAKSIAMAGFERGYNLATEEGLNEWMNVYNEELRSGKIEPPVPNLRGSPLLAFDVGDDYDEGYDSQSPYALVPPAGVSSPGKKKGSTDKARRKMARKSRKQNRKR